MLGTKKYLVGVLFWGMFVQAVDVFAVDYFEPACFQFSVSDAREVHQAGQVQFVGVLSNHQVRLQGLKNTEQAWVEQKCYSIRVLNEWACYDSTPLATEQVALMERYATRYNLIVLALLKQDERGP